MNDAQEVDPLTKKKWCDWYVIGNKNILFFSVSLLTKNIYKFIVSSTTSKALVSVVDFRTFSYSLFLFRSVFPYFLTLFTLTLSRSGSLFRSPLSLNLTPSLSLSHALSLRVIVLFYFAHSCPNFDIEYSILKTILLTTSYKHELNHRKQLVVFHLGGFAWQRNEMYLYVYICVCVWYGTVRQWNTLFFSVTTMVSSV